MVGAVYLLEQIKQDGNGIDMVSRFSGHDGWPPSKTIPQSELTEILALEIEGAIKASPRLAFNNVAPNSTLEHLISTPTPGGPS